MASFAASTLPAHLRLMRNISANHYIHSLKHYVIYHNVTKRGRPKGNEIFAILTNRPVADAIGARIWLISGEGPRNSFSFHVHFVFTAEDSESGGDEGFTHRVYGSEGLRFIPPICLNSEPWFIDLKRTQFFSRGLVEVKASRKLSKLQASEIVAGLEAFASLAREEEEYDDGDGNVILTNLAEVDDQLAHDVAESRTLSDSERSARLERASPLPVRIEVYTTAFLRNADVIVEVLKRADGTCELCRKKAPFLRRSDDTPYLEVHHWKRLSDGGKDTIENAAALCPNCYREVHHGPRMS